VAARTEPGGAAAQVAPTLAPTSSSSVDTSPVYAVFKKRGWL